MVNNIGFTLRVAKKIRDYYTVELMGNIHSLADGKKISVHAIKVEAFSAGKYVVSVLYCGKKNKLFLVDLETFLKSIKKTFDVRLLE